MSVKKSKYPSGEVTWSYCFDAPGSTKANRKQIRERGFATRGEAINAEIERRMDEKKKYELAKIRPVESLPKTLSGLLEAFLRDHAEKNLASKTAERYRDYVGYLLPELLAMSLSDIKPLRLTQEWNRLKESGGHTRRTKESRPMSAKSVRNIAGFVSSAFARAIKWGLVEYNPVKNSELPKAQKKLAIALTPEQQQLVLASASGPWCIQAYLEVDAATGCRRGELLALRWSDIVAGRLIINRSLSQTFREVETEDGKKVRVHDVLKVKSTKTEKPRVVTLPASAISALAVHKQQQDKFKKQFGPDYAEGDLVFANPDGTPLKPDSISASVSALFKRLKIPKPKGASLHLLRHTHTSHLLASGVPLPAVSARLGHSSIRTTQEIYAHMITGQDEEAAKAWEDFQKKSGSQKSDERKV